MKAPRCFGFSPEYKISKEDLKKMNCKSYLCVLTAQSWCDESALANAFPIELFLSYSYIRVKEILNEFFSAVASHATQTFVRSYAKKCQEFYKSNQGDDLLLYAIRDRSSVINIQQTQKQIELEKRSAEVEGELNGVKLSRLGGKKYSRELDNALYEITNLERRADTLPTSTSSVSRPTTTTADNQDSSTVSYHDEQAATILFNSVTDDLDREELSVTEDGLNDQTERAAAVAVDMTSEITEDELPIPLVKEFYEWMYALLLGKDYVSKNSALDNYAWDETSPRDALNQTAYVLLSQYNSKCSLDFCALQLTLSYIVNLANEEMKYMVQPCLRGTSIEQWLYGIKNNETNSEQVGDRYDCIGKLGDKICQPLFDKEQKDREKCYQDTLRNINKMKGKYLENAIDCLELQILDIYEYLLRNIYKFEDLNIDGSATEADFFNAIYPIISIIIRRTQDLKSRSGEGACQATRGPIALLKKKFNVQNSQRIYGRKIDLLFIDQKYKVELCSSEWKKRDVSVETLLCQQTKNLRVSKCIFKKIAQLNIPLPELQSLSIDIMDWRGFDGYILQMKFFDGIYLVDLNSTVHIPTHVSQVSNFKDSLVSLFKWKDKLVELKDTISFAKAVASSSSSFDGIINARKRSPSPVDYTYFSPKKPR